MKMRHWIIGSTLLLLVAAAAGGLMETRDTGLPTPGAPVSRHARRKNLPPPKDQLVDTRPMLTARLLATLAATPEEQEFAHQAARLANHEVDLAFADALHQAAENPPPLTAETRELAALKVKADEAVDADQLHIKGLTRQLAVAREQQKDALEDQLDVAKAQLELDQDELDQATEDLERAGGDPQAKIRHLKEAHEAADKQPVTGTAPGLSGITHGLPAGSLIAKLGTWIRLREKSALLAQAHQEALDASQGMEQQRGALSQRVKQEADQRTEVKRSAAGFSHGGQKAGGSSRQAAKDTLASLKHFMRDQRTLTDFGKRIEDQRELSDVYGSWMIAAEAQERAALHQALRGALTILLILTVLFFSSTLVDHLFLRQEELRAGTLRTVVKFALHAVGALVILFVVIGMPGQTTTILGLAGAGLTVALKDFIVAFFGWFILMGRNGLRVGDWVEIKGVGGEVVEVGLLRTVLLETGSWSDSGHPTGRRVAFVNSFAIEGHYFNFTTSGQWMWDELQVLVPPGQDPYPLIDGIQKLVEETTEANARLAEKEWQSATTRYRVQAFTAVPGINVVPTSAGIEIRVRYITRAYERHETRNSLYQAVVDLMHGKRGDEETEA